VSRNTATSGGSRSTWLNWCASRKRWSAPQLPGDAERRKEHADRTRALPRARIERLLSPRDLPLREKTLWRMLYETAAQASEILALNVQDLDLEQRPAPIRSKGGDTEFVYWDTRTAHLLPRPAARGGTKVIFLLPDRHRRWRIQSFRLRNVRSESASRKIPIQPSSACRSPPDLIPSRYGQRTGEPRGSPQTSQYRG